MKDEWRLALRGLYLVLCVDGNSQIVPCHQNSIEQRDPPNGRRRECLHMPMSLGLRLRPALEARTEEETPTFHVPDDASSHIPSPKAGDGCQANFIALRHFQVGQDVLQQQAFLHFLHRNEGLDGVSLSQLHRKRTHSVTKILKLEESYSPSNALFLLFLYRQVHLVYE